MVSEENRWITKGIEVGHMFYGGDTYSRAMGEAVYLAGGQEALLPSDLGTLFLGASDYYSSNDMSQYQLYAVWENQDDSALRSVKFGISKYEQDWRNQNMYSGQLPAGWW